MLTFQCENSRESERDGKYHREAKCSNEGNFPPSFSVQFLSIFVHISSSIDPITAIWVGLEKSFCPAGGIDAGVQLRIFVKDRMSSRPVAAGIGGNGLKLQSYGKLEKFCSAFVSWSRAV